MTCQRSLAQASCIALVAWTAMGCTGSPQPIPPPFVSATSLSLRAEGGVLTLVGGAGAVNHADQLSIFNLFAPAPVQEQIVPVGSDGSFSTTLSGALDDVLRLQAQSTQAGDGPAVSIASQLDAVVVVDAAPCIEIVFSMPPTLGGHIDVGGVSVGSELKLNYTIRNTCPEGYAVDVYEALAAPGWDWRPMGVFPLQLEAGVSQSFEATFAPDTSGAQSELVAFKFTATDGDFTVRSFTVQGRGE